MDGILKEHQKDFVHEVCRALKIYPAQDFFERPMILTVTQANYGRPSIVVIELQGSPPRLPIVADISDGHCRILHACGRPVRPYGSTEARLAAALRKLMEAEGIEDGPRHRSTGSEVA